MKKIFRVTVYIFGMAGAFGIGYRLTDAWFRVKLVPYPFELYGILAGLLLAFLALAVFQAGELLFGKFSGRKNKSKPYIVKVNRISEVELFK